MTIRRYDSYSSIGEEDPQGRFVLLEDVQKAISKVADETILRGTFDALCFERVKARLEVFQAIAKELNIPIFTASQKRTIKTSSFVKEEIPNFICDEIIQIKKD